jgi:ribosomal protein L14E/L6E/L27E
MALKFRITKSSFDKLSDDFKAEYSPDGDKHYKLDVDGLDDNGALKSAKERAETELEDLKGEHTELTKKYKDLEKAGGEGGKDIQKVQDRYERKLVTQKEASDLVLASRDAFIKSQLVDNQASALANELSTVPTLLSDRIKSRLDVDFTGDAPKLVIKGKDGQPNAQLTIDGLKQEILATAEFKPILRANKASGGATQQGTLPAPGATQAQQQATGPVNVNELSSKDFVERVKARHAAEAANNGGQAAQQ